MSKRPIVALLYDFDKTLCTKDMQEYGYIESIGMKSSEFWKEVAEFTDSNQMDNILAYMYKMVERARISQVPVKRTTFAELGKKVEFFPGVLNWFTRINDFGESIGVRVEHYIVSSGIKEIIEGTDIFKEFKKVYACEFLYDYNDTIVWPKVAVNYTAKTQFLFRINKGVLNIDTLSANKLNNYTPEKERRVPFKNMIYIGDGLTDVPCMKLVKSNGGVAIAVYDEGAGKAAAKELLKNNRVNFIAPADYSKNTEIEEIVKATIRKIQAVTVLEQFESD